MQYIDRRQRNGHPSTILAAGDIDYFMKTGLAELSQIAESEKTGLNSSKFFLKPYCFIRQCSDERVVG